MEDLFEQRVTFFFCAAGLEAFMERLARLFLAAFFTRWRRGWLFAFLETLMEDFLSTGLTFFF
jgi:hypothetical protein